jgi:hypothetical protein
MPLHLLKFAVNEILENQAVLTWIKGLVLVHDKFRLAVILDRRKERERQERGREKTEDGTQERAAIHGFRASLLSLRGFQNANCK